MTEKCSICLEEMVGDLGVAVPCGHCFHRDCFARLKADRASKRAKMTCCVCKRKVKKFHNIYFNVSPCCPVDTCSEKSMVEDTKQENAQLKKSLQELQTLSNDQGDILLRILPRYDKLESRCLNVKRENRHLRKQVEALKDENWDLLFENMETKTKLSHAESRLEETEGENMDLHAIWDILDERLEKSREEKKGARKREEKLSKELEAAKRKLFSLERVPTYNEVKHPSSKSFKRRRVSFDSST